MSNDLARFETPAGYVGHATAIEPCQECGAPAPVFARADAPEYFETVCAHDLVSPGEAEEILTRAMYHLSNTSTRDEALLEATDEAIAMLEAIGFGCEDCGRDLDMASLALGERRCVVCRALVCDDCERSFGPHSICRCGGAR